MLKGIDASEAIRLWDSYCSGNENDLNTLLKYNREDLQGMLAIKQHLSALGRLHLS